MMSSWIPISAERFDGAFTRSDSALLSTEKPRFFNIVIEVDFGISIPMTSEIFLRGTEIVAASDLFGYRSTISEMTLPLAIS